MLGVLLDRIRGNHVANEIMTMLGKLGMDRFFYMLFYKYFEKHPSVAMRNSSAYFNRHEKDIEMIKGWLADEKSKKIWEQMIEFRKTMNYKLHPGRELPQYFVKEIIQFNQNERFIDCGGFDGATSLEFIHSLKILGGGYESIVIFEPDKLNVRLIKEKTADRDHIVLIEKGLWNKHANIGFRGSGNSSSKVIELDENCTDFSSIDTIEVVAMDDVAECKDATFIKMDLEGSEIMALKGAEKIIKRNKPKLAVCIYHSDQDMLEIIQYIHRLVPEYKLFVRQHANSYNETVLYAVV